MGNHAIDIERFSPDAGKSLFQVSNPTPYLKDDTRHLQDQVYCEVCGADYLIGQLVVDPLGEPKCPAQRETITKGNEECEGSLELLITLNDARQLRELRKKYKPEYPFLSRGRII